MFTPLARAPLHYNMSANFRWMAFLYIDGMGMMTAQERKDFRRVQASREVWKKRAVSRGEQSRRFRERRIEVDRSREGWRDRALAAEHRVEELEIAHHQLKSAAMQTRQLNAIDNTNFF